MFNRSILSHIWVYWALCPFRVSAICNWAYLWFSISLTMLNLLVLRPIISLLSVCFIAQSPVFWLLTSELFQVSLMIFKKPHLVIMLPPIRVEPPRLLLINIIVMVSFLNIITNFLFNNFPPLIVQHSLLSNPIDSRAVLVCLLLLRNSIPSFVLSHIIFKVVLSDYFTIRTHFWRADEALANVGTGDTFLVHIFMGIRELKHIFEWVSAAEFHHSPKEGIAIKTSEASHYLVDFSKGVIIKFLKLLRMAVSTPAHVLYEFNIVGKVQNIYIKENSRFTFYQKVMKEIENCLKFKFKQLNHMWKQSTMHAN